MNVRNEIKAQIIRAGMTMQEELTCSRTNTDGATAFPICPQNYSGKASDIRKYWSLPAVLGYDIVWQKRREK